MTARPGEEVGDDQVAEVMRAEDLGQAGILELALKPEAHGVGPHGPAEEMLLLTQGRPKQEHCLGSGVGPSRRQILSKLVVEVVADGDLALLASLFPYLRTPGNPGPRGSRAEAGPRRRFWPTV